MATLLAQVTILRRKPAGSSGAMIGSAVIKAWRDAVVVTAGESFVETDTAEIARLVGSGAACVP